MIDTNNCSSYSSKKSAIKKIEETINSVKNSIIPQLGYLIGEQVKTYIISLNKKELSIDIKSKVNSFQSLLNNLEQNKSKIENNGKAKIFPYRKYLQKGTKLKNVISYLYDIGINCYYEIDVEIEKNWFCIFFTFFWCI